MHCIFQIDHERVKDNGGRLIEKGLADLADGTELKSPHECSSKNTVIAT